MSRLGGQFAGILRVEIPSEREHAFVEGTRGLQVKGLTLVVVPDVPGRGGASGQAWVMELIGQDRPGIVRQISHALAARGVNVEDLHTECVSAPMSGETLFKARALIHVPPGCDVAELRQAMEKVAADLIVDIALSEVRAPA